MNLPDIARIRLQNQWISGDNSKTVVEITRDMGAIQSQDYYSMLWSLGVRTSLTKQQIVGELEKIKVLRTWPQRGTIHLIPTNDAFWQIGLSGERMLRSMKRRREQLALDEKTFDKAQRIFEKKLKGKTLLSRPNAMDLLANNGLSIESGRGYHILVNLALKGIIFIGPMEDKKQTIGLLKNWATPNQKINKEENLIELTRRYFLSHGPATIDDFCWWSGLTKKDVKLGLERNQEILIAKSVAGKEYFAGKEMWAADTKTEKAFLLSGFDEFMLGYKDRSAVLPPEYSNKIVPGGNGMFLPTIIINGQVVGTWKRKIKKTTVDISLYPFYRLSKSALKLLEAPIQSYARFLEREANVEIKKDL